MSIRLHLRNHARSTDLTTEHELYKDLERRANVYSHSHNLDQNTWIYINPLRAKFFRFTFYVIPPHWYDTGGWNPSSNKTKIYPFYIVNIIVAGVLATKGARTSATDIGLVKLGPRTLRVKYTQWGFHPQKLLCFQFATMLILMQMKLKLRCNGHYMMITFTDKNTQNL